MGCQSGRLTVVDLQYSSDIVPPTFQNFNYSIYRQSKEDARDS